MVPVSVLFFNYWPISMINWRQLIDIYNYFLTTGRLQYPLPIHLLIYITEIGGGKPCLVNGLWPSIQLGCLALLREPTKNDCFMHTFRV